MFCFQIGTENLSTKIEIDKEADYYKNLSNPMKICISNASSPVCYHLINSIASGEIFGYETELTINLLDFADQLCYLEGTRMEAVDLARNLLRNVCVTADCKAALSDCEAVIILDQLVREGEEEEESWVIRNCEMLSERLKQIDDHCKPDVKVLIAGHGPMNTALYKVQREVTKINKRNIIAMPRLAENQAKAILSRRVKVNSNDIVDLVMWGDQEKHHCDISHARVHNHDGPIWGPPTYSRLATLLVSSKSVNYHGIDHWHTVRSLEWGLVIIKIHCSETAHEH